MEVSGTTEIGDVDVDCPLCKKVKEIMRKEGMTPEKLDELFPDPSCTLCEGKGTVTVFVGETEVTLDVDMSDYAPDNDWRD